MSEPIQNPKLGFKLKKRHSYLILLTVEAALSHISGKWIDPYFLKFESHEAQRDKDFFLFISQDKTRWKKTTSHSGFI